MAGLPFTMSLGFIIFVPFAIGAITVYIAETIQDRSVVFYLFAPWLTIVLFALGTILTALEGAICVLIGMPVFLVAGSLSGLLTGLLCRRPTKPTHTVQSIGLLPILVFLGEAGLSTPQINQQVSETIHIAASPTIIWHQLNFPTNIRPEELKEGWAYKIGVPYPVEARTLQQRVGGIRRLIWQRGVSFEEEITAWSPNRYIAWRYKFSPHSFPPGSLDDHVVLGGKYFDLEGTSYTLTPDGKGTRLDISVSYRFATNFNWYAGPWAKFLISDTAATILKFYKRRAESSQVLGNTT